MVTFDPSVRATKPGAVSSKPAPVASESQTRSEKDDIQERLKQVKQLFDEGDY